jgi:hypothetical protein
MSAVRAYDLSIRAAPFTPPGATLSLAEAEAGQAAPDLANLSSNIERQMQ